MKVPKYYRVNDDPRAHRRPARRNGIATEREFAERFDTSAHDRASGHRRARHRRSPPTHPGRGTFVSQPKLMQVRQATSFSQDLAAEAGAGKPHPRRERRGGHRGDGRAAAGRAGSAGAAGRTPADPWGRGHRPRGRAPARGLPGPRRGTGRARLALPHAGRGLRPRRGCRRGQCRDHPRRPGGRRPARGRHRPPPACSCTAPRGTGTASPWSGPGRCFAETASGSWPATGSKTSGIRRRLLAR